MKQISVQALVIKVMDVGENDRLVTLLTRDMGVIKAFAPSAKKMKSKNYSGTAFLSFSSFLIEEVKDTLRIRDASLEKSYFKLGCDIAALALQQYFCELCSFLTPPEENSEEILKLLLKSISVINEGKMSFSLIKAIFELRLLSISGFMPNLVACCNCGEYNEDEMSFDYENGCLYCADCAIAVEAVKLPATATLALRHIVFSDFSKLFSFSVPEEYAEKLAILTENYLLMQTEYNYKTLNFYKSIRG